MRGVNFNDGSVSGAPNSAFIHNVVEGASGSGRNNCDATPSNPAGSLNNPDCVNNQFVGTNSSLGGNFSNTEAWGGSLIVDFQISDSTTFKSISSYRKLDAHFTYDADHTSLVINDKIEDILKQKQVSQEFQLIGTSEKPDWVMGLYYFRETGSNPNPVSLTFAPGGPTDILSGGAFKNDSKAAFAHLTAHLTDRIDLTVGARYTKDTKRFTPDQFITSHALSPRPVFLRLMPMQEYTRSFNDFTPMVNLSYHWNDSLMTYATYSSGFKGGGFTQRLAAPAATLPSFGPEKVKNYEIGIKYQSPDGGLTLNAAAFYMDYTDIQITVFVGVATTLDNAGTASVKGGELELK